MRLDDQERALGEMIMDGIFFLTDTSSIFVQHKDEKPGRISVELNCNDVFYWATADSEPVTLDEIPDLYMRWRKSRKWGPVKWVAVKRKLRPQVPMVNHMKADGAWDDEMEALPAPAPS